VGQLSDNRIGSSQDTRRHLTSPEGRQDRLPDDLAGSFIR
jgi:hypothetical protein